MTDDSSSPQDEAPKLEPEKWTETKADVKTISKEIIEALVKLGQKLGPEDETRYSTCVVIVKGVIDNTNRAAMVAAIAKAIDAHIQVDSELMQRSIVFGDNFQIAERAGVSKVRFWHR